MLACKKAWDMLTPDDSFVSHLHSFNSGAKVDDAKPVLNYGSVFTYQALHVCLMTVLLLYKFITNAVPSATFRYLMKLLNVAKQLSILPRPHKASYSSSAQG